MHNELLAEYYDVRQESDCLLGYMATLQRRQRADSRRGLPETPEHRALLRVYNQLYKSNQSQLKEAEELLGAVTNTTAREILRLHYMDGRTWEDVAERCCYSIGNVFRLAKLAEEQIADSLSVKKKGGHRHDRKGKKN